MTVPSTVASIQSPVELRLSLLNPSAVARTFAVEFAIDSFTHPLGSSFATVAPDAYEFVSLMWDPRTSAGHREVLYRVSEGATVTQQGSWSLQIIDASFKAPPFFGAAWLEPGRAEYDANITADEIRARIDELHAMKMDTIVIAYVEYAMRPYYPSRIEGFSAHIPAGFDEIGTIMDAAAANGMHVALGLGQGPIALNLDTEGVTSHSDMDRSVGFAMTVAQELLARYGDRSSFYGWYISQEANNYSVARYFYDRLAARLHALGPERPVIVAPAGAPVGITQETLPTMGPDIFAYQDAVGAGYAGPDNSCMCRPYAYTYNPYNRIDDLDDVYTRYEAWHAGSAKHIWADLEIWQMDGPLYGPNPYAAACYRVRDQMEIEREHVSMLSAYEYLGYMRSPTNTTTMPTSNAEQLYTGYKAYVDGLTPRLCPGMGRAPLLASL